jgi:hypothetical protein
MRGNGVRSPRAAYPGRGGARQVVRKERCERVVSGCERRKVKFKNTLSAQRETRQGKNIIMNCVEDGGGSTETRRA